MRIIKCDRCGKEMPFEEADYKVTIKPSVRIEDVSLGGRHDKGRSN